MTRIRPQVMDDIRRHAAADYPDECCGLLVAGPGGAQRAVPMRNVQDEMHAKDPAAYPRTARTAYVPHPRDYREALDAADAEGCSLLAFYHSHPDEKSYFSAEDLAQATPFGEPSYPDALQFVVSVIDGEVRDVRAFAWSEDERNYVETAFEEADEP